MMKKLIGLVLVMLVLGAHGICESAFPNVQAIRDFRRVWRRFRMQTGIGATWIRLAMW